MSSTTEFMERCVKMFFFTTQLIEKRQNALPFLGTLLQFCQNLLVSFLLLRRQLQKLAQIMPNFLITEKVLIVATQLIDSAIQFDGPSQKLCLGLGLLGFLFIIQVLILRFRFASVNSKQFVSWIPVVLLLCFRLAMFSVAAQTYFIFTKSNASFPMLADFRFVLVPAFLLPCVYCLFLNRNSLTLWYMHPITPIIFFSDPSNQLLQICILLACVYSLYFRCLAEAQILYLNAFLILSLQLLVSRATATLNMLETIQIGLMVVFTALPKFIPVHPISISQKPQIRIEKQWGYGQRKKDCKLNVEDQFQIQQVIVDCFVNGELKDLGQVSFKPVEAWTKNEHLALLQIQINSFKKSTHQKKALLFQYKFYLEDEKRNLKTLLEIRSQFQKLRGSSLLYRLELYKLMMALQTTLSRDRKEITYIESLLTIDQEVTTFYEKLYNALQILKQIWSSYHRMDIDFGEIQAKYAKVLKQKQNISKLYKQIEKKSQAPKQLERLIVFQSLLDLAGEDDQLNVNRDFADDSLQFFKKYSQTPFLIVLERNITYVSFSFMQEYKYGLDDLTMSDIEAIVPHAFKNRLICNSKSGSSLKLQAEPQIILNGQNQMVLVSTTTYIFPEFADGVKYIIFFENKAQLQGRQSYLLFNLATEMVEDFSEGFMHSFELDVDLLNGNPVIEGKTIFQGFNFHNQDNISQLNSKEGVPANIYLKKFGSSQDRIKVVLNSIVQFTDMDRPRIVIEVHRGMKLFEHIPQVSGSSCRKRVRKAQSKFKMCDLISSKCLGTADESSVVKLLNEVSDKKRSLKRENNKKSLYPLLILIYALGTSLLLCFIGLYVASQERIAWFKNMIGQIDGLSERNLLFSEMYLQSLNLYHLKKYPPPNLSAKQISTRESKVSSQLKTTTLKFQQAYVKSIRNQKFQPVYFGLVYKNFKLQANTNQIVLIDFVWQSTLEGTSNYILTFMMDNYETVRILNQQIQSLELYLLDYNIFISLSVGISYLGLALVLGFYIVFVIFARRIEKTLEDIQSFFGYLPLKHQKKILQQIENLSLQFHQIAAGSQEIRTKNNIEDIPSRQDQVETNKQIKTKSKFLIKCWIILLVILLVYGGYTLGLLSNLGRQKNQTMKAIHFGHKIKLDIVNTKISLLDIYYSAILAKDKPTVIHSPTLFKSITTKMLVQATDDSVPSDFGTRLWLYLNQNICKLSQNQQQYEPCRKVYNGILMQGFLKSIKFYQQALQNLSLKPLDSFYSDNVLSDCVLTHKLLIDLMNFIDSKYIQSQYVLAKDLNKNSFGIVAVNICLLLFIGIVFYGQYRWAKERIDICKSMFVNSPNEMLYSEQARRYFEDANLLERLGNL